MPVYMLPILNGVMPIATTSYRNYVFRELKVHKHVFHSKCKCFVYRGISDTLTVLWCLCVCLPLCRYSLTTMAA